MKKILTIILFSILLTGCGYTKEEKVIMRQLEKQGRENAISYIKEKYDIDAKIVSTELDKYGNGPLIDVTPDPTGYVIVEFEYKKEKFKVIILGDKKTNKGRDNYQLKDIKRDTLDYFKSITNVDPINYTFFYKEEENSNIEHDYGYIDYKYDKSMIKDIINSDDFKIVLEYTDNLNLESLKNNTELSNIKNFLMVEYISKDHYNGLENHDFGINDSSYKNGVSDVTSFKKTVRRNGYALTESLHNGNDGLTYHKFSFNKVDTILYSDFIDNKSYLIKSTISDPKNWNLDEVIYNAYEIKNYKNYMIINIPKSEIENISRSKYFVLECKRNDVQVYYNLYLENHKYGNYYTVELEEECTSNVKFSVMIKK